jgi:PPOX class probable F420-dependent enzyme
VNRRAAIRMSDEEALAFLDAERTVIVATNGPGGFPHLMPLWYVVRTGRIWAWTYAKSQKVKNLERDPRATLQVEAGDSYEQLHGVMLRAEAVLHRDPQVVEELAMELVTRYSGPGADTEAMREGFRRQVPKRVAIEFAERDRVTWDHRKLGGTY